MNEGEVPVGEAVPLLLPGAGHAQATVHHRTARRQSINIGLLFGSCAGNFNIPYRNHVFM